MNNIRLLSGWIWTQYDHGQYKCVYAFLVDVRRAKYRY